eukprot:7284130-Alexandrium_andersonii.AAC.1
MPSRPLSRRASPNRVPPQERPSPRQCAPPPNADRDQPTSAVQLPDTRGSTRSRCASAYEG